MVAERLLAVTLQADQGTGNINGDQQTKDWNQSSRRPGRSGPVERRVNQSTAPL